MILILFKAELHGNREVTVNGMPLERNSIIFEEKIIEKQLAPEQVWAMLCELKRTVSKLEHSYQAARSRNGEEKNDFDRMREIRSGAGGVPGTTLRPLILP
jgi:hypothetical protein